MKKYIITIIAVFCFILAIVLNILASNVKATIKNFGIQEYRGQGIQYAYKIADKNIWKLVTYNGETIDSSRTIYCLNADQGFYNSNPSTNKQEYDLSYDLKNKASIPVLPVTIEEYNSIIWILNHIYVQSDTTISNYKDTLLKNAKIDEDIRLTDDDIDVVQQLAIWYFTNKNDEEYHTEEPTLKDILIAKKDANGILEDYTKIEEKDNIRFMQMQNLFKYFLENAKLATEEENNILEPLKMDSEKPSAEIQEDNYIIGPYKINKQNDLPYEVNIKLIDQIGNDLNGKYTLLNANKQELTDKKIEEIIGQEFYLKIPAQTIIDKNISKITFKVDGRYTTTKATYWTSSEETEVQPIIEIEKLQQLFNYENEVILPNYEDRNILNSTNIILK